jgi:solute carrier family 25 carnitine/acylcarnitine transporter 20/29
MPDKPAVAAFAGAAAGASQVLAEHPLDVVKVRLQSRLQPFVGIEGASQMLRTTVQHEGIAALFQGITPRLLAYSVVKLSLFSLYEWIKPWCLGSTAVAGALAGACNTIVSCPQDLLKSQLQVRQIRPEGRWRTAMQYTQGMVHAHGLRVFYRGLAPLILRDSLGYACLFSVFEWGQGEPRMPTWLTGGLSGVAFYTTTMPIDRVKTVVMTQSLVTRASSAQVAADILAREGLCGFYRGCTVTLLRTFWGQAVALTVYGTAMNTRSSTR